MDRIRTPGPALGHPSALAAPTEGAGTPPRTGPTARAEPQPAGPARVQEHGERSVRTRGMVRSTGEFDFAAHRAELAAMAIMAAMPTGDAAAPIGGDDAVRIPPLPRPVATGARAERDEAAGDAEPADAPDHKAPSPVLSAGGQPLWQMQVADALSSGLYFSRRLADARASGHGVARVLDAAQEFGERIGLPLVSAPREFLQPSERPQRRLPPGPEVLAPADSDPGSSSADEEGDAVDP